LSFATVLVLVGAPALLDGSPSGPASPTGDDAVERARQALSGFSEFVERAIKDWEVPGSAIAIIYGGEIVFAEGFGLRDIKNDRPMTADTLFAIGSTTKAMTTTVLGMLVDEGLLDWDEPVRTYLPEFRLHDPVTTELITPRDLVTHRSGLPRHDMVWYNDNESSREEIVRRIAYLETSERLRAKFQYNNLMYLTAGHLIERLTGDDWEAAVRARILKPLGMNRSNFSIHDSQKDDDFAQPYRENDEGAIERIPFRVIDLMAPAGAVNSSVNEMSRWLLFNLNQGQVGDRRLINTNTLADIHSPHMVTGGSQERPEISQEVYGLGWSIDTYRGRRRVSHGGGIDGFITSVVLFPDDGLGLVSFTNIGSPLSGILNQHAADRILGLEPIDWNGEGLERRAKGEEAEKKAAEKKQTMRVSGTNPTHPVADYAGTYHHPGYGDLEIALAEGALSVTFNGITAPLEHWHYDVFNGVEAERDTTFEDSKFLFRGDVDGNIAAVESSFEPRVDPILFRKRPDAKLYDPDHLRRFVGRYDLAGEVFTVELAGETLAVNFPGAPQYTLVPTLSGRFAFKEFALLSLAFQEKGGKVVAAMLYQPDGIYEARRVEPSE
jgi:CubicO group peptidase (beta-lactamase class C family)